MKTRFSLPFRPTANGVDNSRRTKKSSQRQHAR